MVTYRFVIYTDSVRENKIGAASVGEKLTFKRDSKRATEDALQKFYDALSAHVPDGHNARAWLERSNSHGYNTNLLRFEGKSLTSYPLGHPFGRYGAAATGEWISPETGEVVKAG